MKVNQLKAGAALNYAIIVLHAIIGLVYTPYMLHKLGQSEFGLYSFVSSAIAYLTLMHFGFGNVVVRYMEKYARSVDRNGSFCQSFDYGYELFRNGKEPIARQGNWLQIEFSKVTFSCTGKCHFYEHSHCFAAVSGFCCNQYLRCLWDSSGQLPNPLGFPNHNYDDKLYCHRHLLDILKDLSLEPFYLWQILGLIALWYISLLTPPFYAYYLGVLGQA